VAAPEGCPCPTEWPDWDGRDVDLSAALVHVMPIRTLFNMPLGYESFHQRQAAEIGNLEVKERWPGVVLSHVGWFKGRLLRVLDEEQAVPPHHRIERLPTPFRLRARLHRGNVSTIREPYLALQRDLVYLTCPACEAAKGGEQILMLRRWEESPRLQRRRRPSGG